MENNGNTENMLQRARQILSKEQDIPLDEIDFNFSLIANADGSVTWDDRASSFGGKKISAKRLARA
jgi:hypothetical protein